MNKSKTLKIAVPVIICVIAAVIFLFFIPGFGLNSRSWEEYYELGMQYLEEENYEEAIVAFTSAIRVDDKQAVAYTGRGDAHMGYATQLEEDPEIEEQYTEAIADYETAVELGDAEAEPKLKAAQNALENHRNMAEYEELLAELYDVFASGDTEAAEELIKQDEYVAMRDSIEDDHLYYDEGEGNGLGVYPGGFYYFGGWKDGERNGHGIWIKDTFSEDGATDRYIFEGEWVGDRPNGEGIVTQEEKPHGSLYAIKTETSGNYADGLGNGQITETIQWSDGSNVTVSFEVINGICQPTGEMHPYENRPYVAIGSDGTPWLYSGEVDIFVYGFRSE